MKTNYTTKDIFISYGRRESLGFVGKLHQRLKLEGYDVWFDKVNIPDGDDYSKRINNGIESADNFVFILAPRCLTSVYCLIELEYAYHLGKRIIPVNQDVIFSTSDNRILSEGEKIALENFYTTCDIVHPPIRTAQDVIDRSHKLLGKRDWLDAKEQLSDKDCESLAKWASKYENHWSKHEQVAYLKQFEFPQFGKSIDDLDSVVERILTVIKRQKKYIRRHTKILQHALNWKNNRMASRYLLVGKEKERAEEWLLTEFLPPKQPPCSPSVLHCDFICESRKNGENRMTDIFICHSEGNNKIRQQIERALAKFAVTTWSPERDIDKGEQYDKATLRGIEQADNFLYCISPEEIVSQRCTTQLKYAISLNKRIIPLLIAPLKNIQNNEVTEAIKGLQFIDFSDNVRSADFKKDIDDILNIIRKEENYFHEHKVLLSRSLKWEREHKKPSFLLRGYNLENAQTWLRLNEKRREYAPTESHKDFIHNSEAAKGRLKTDVFISYSRKDADFARKLNNKLQEAGKTTWFDQESISSGVDFETEIFKGIDTADNIVFIISPDSVNSEYCEREVEYAQAQNKRFITILCRQTEDSTIPHGLKSINWIDFINHKFAQQFSRLIQAIEIDREHTAHHTVLQLRAVEWEEHDRSTEFLLNATACTNALTWISEAYDLESHNLTLWKTGKNKTLEKPKEVLTPVKQPAPTTLQHNFIQASEEAILMATAKQRKEKRRLVALLAAAMIALGFSVFQTIKANQAEETAEKAREAAIGLAKEAKKKTEEALLAKQEAKASEEEALNQKAEAVKARKEAEEQAWKAEKKSFEGTLFLLRDKAEKLISFDNTQAIRWTEIAHQMYKKKRGRYKLSYQTEVPIVQALMSSATQSMSHPYSQEKRFESNVSKAVFSPDSKWLLTLQANNQAILTDLKSGNTIHIQDFESEASTIAFSPNNKIIATDGYKNIVKLRNLKGRDVATLDAHTGNIIAVKFSPYGKLILTTSEDSTAKLWTTQGKLLLDLKENDLAVKKALFSPNGKEVLVHYSDHSIHIFDFKGNKQAVIKEHRKQINKITFSPNGYLFATCSDDKTAKIWNMEGKMIATLNKHTAKVNTIAFSPDSKYILTGSNDSTAKLWDLKGKLKENLTEHDSPIKSVSFSPNGRILLTHTTKNTANVWHLRGFPLSYIKGVHAASFTPDSKGVLVRSDELIKIQALNGDEVTNLYHTARPIFAEVSPDHQIILTSAKDQTIKLWQLQANKFKSLGNHSRNVSSIVVTTDKKWLLTNCYDYVNVWDMEGNLKTTLKGGRRIYNPVLYSSKSKLIATRSDSLAQLWNLDGELIANLKGHQSNIEEVKFSPNQRLVMTRSRDNDIKIWDVKGNSIATINQFEKHIESVLFSPNSKTLLTQTSTEVKLWKTNGTPISTLDIEGDEIINTQFSPNGWWILTTTGKSLKIWNTKGKLIRTISQHPAPIDFATFTPNSQAIVSHCGAKNIYLWNIYGKKIATLNKHTSAIKEISFSPNKRYLLSTADDNTAKLWNMSGQLLADMNQHEGHINQAIFSPKGNRILTSADDNTAKLWDLKGRLLVDFNQHQRAVNKSIFSPDGKYIITNAFTDIKLWDLQGNFIVDIEKYADNASNVMFTPDSQYLITKSGKNVDLWHTPFTLLGWLSKEALMNKLSLGDLEKQGLEQDEIEYMKQKQVVE